MAEDAVETSLRALATFLVGGSTVERTLQRIIDLAATAVPPAAYTGLTMLVEDKVTTAVFSDPDAAEIDQAQYTSGHGPCLDAFRHRRSYTIASTQTDVRRPDFSRAALDHGIESTMSLPLAAGDEPLGALNFYATAENAFSEGDEETGEGFATQAAVVLANAQAYWDVRALSEQMAEAMRSRATIEQAKGIIIAQSHVDADTVFGMLRRASQGQNRKLRDVAEEIVQRNSRPHAK